MLNKDNVGLAWYEITPAGPQFLYSVPFVFCVYASVPFHFYAFMLVLFSHMGTVAKIQRTMLMSSRRGQGF